MSAGGLRHLLERVLTRLKDEYGAAGNAALI